MPKITVAMASYNHAPFVGEAIESVLAQKNCDFEFIIVDDGSKDNTVNEIKKYTDPRIKLICFEKNQGACVALRKAIESGTGEYVAILNSDDAFLEGKLVKQANFLDSNPHIDAVFGFPQIIDSEGKKIDKKKHYCGDAFYEANRTRHEWINSFFYRTNTLCHPTVMIKRECYNDLGYYDPRMSQLPDFDFWVRIAQKYEIFIMNEELIKFRILPNELNASFPSKENLRRCQWEMAQILPQFLKMNSLDEFVRCFPEDKEFIDLHKQIESQYLIPFVLSLKALSLSQAYNPTTPIAARTNGYKIPEIYCPSYAIFGMQTLYSLFNQKDFVEKVAPALNFDFVKLNQLSKHFDIFRFPLRPTFSKRLKNLFRKIYRKILQKK
ncbi:MAG: glycosyltransferase [Parachlamydiaceae bacterium]|nr:glycosyltransferase [Parachlamydiaceae bacterium]